MFPYKTCPTKPSMICCLQAMAVTVIGPMSRLFWPWLRAPVKYMALETQVISCVHGPYGFSPVLTGIIIILLWTEQTRLWTDYGADTTRLRIESNKFIDGSYGTQCPWRHIKVRSYLSCSANYVMSETDSIFSKRTPKPQAPNFLVEKIYTGKFI